MSLPVTWLQERTGSDGITYRAHKEGTTIVMVTHSQHDAGFADRVINLFDGQVVTEVNL